MLTRLILFQVRLMGVFMVNFSHELKKLSSSNFFKKMNNYYLYFCLYFKAHINKILLFL